MLSLKAVSNEIHVHVRWKGLEIEEDTLDPIAYVCEDVRSFSAFCTNASSLWSVSPR